MKVFNPATEELLAEVSEDTKATLSKKIALLKRNQLIWSDRNLDDRIECISKFDLLLEQRKEVLAKLLTAEMGKPIQESYNEINGARKRIKFFIENSKKHLCTQSIFNDGTTEDVLAFEPLGIVSYISAWNYPYLIFCNVVIPALIGGNGVLYKPSEFTTLTGLELEKLFQESCGSEIVIVATGGQKIGEAILELDLDGYFFTGSYNTGHFISEKVKSRLVPVGLELGGKDPLYVTNEIDDISKVAGACVEGSFYNNGQSCCAVERIYVHEKVYDQFVSEFVQQTEKLKVGDPMDEKTQQGAITRKSHLEFLEIQIEEAVEKGAKILTGGSPLTIVGNKGTFFEPTVLVNVNHSMSVMKQETFGPVIGIQKVSDDDEAIHLMNDTDYGLTAAVYSKNIDRAKNILAKINSGTAYINCCDRVSAHLPWSGRKHSGLGSTLSYLGILTFVRPKAYHIRGA